jgi:iron(III) transport system permease protein
MQMGILSALFGTTLGFIFAYSSVNCEMPLKRLVHVLALILTISPPSYCLGATAWSHDDY